MTTTATVKYIDTDRQGWDEWIRQLDREIEEALNNLLTYGEPYFRYIANSEGYGDIVERYGIADITEWYHLDVEAAPTYYRHSVEGTVKPAPPSRGNHRMPWIAWAVNRKLEE